MHRFNAESKVCEKCGMGQAYAEAYKAECGPAYYRPSMTTQEEAEWLAKYGHSVPRRMGHEYNAVTMECSKCGKPASCYPVTLEQQRCGESTVQRLNSAPFHVVLHDDARMGSLYRMIGVKFPGHAYAAVFVAGSKGNLSDRAVVILDVCVPCESNAEHAYRRPGGFQQARTGSFVISRERFETCRPDEWSVMMENLAGYTLERMKAVPLGGPTYADDVCVEIETSTLYRIPTVPVGGRELMQAEWADKGITNSELARRINEGRYDGPDPPPPGVVLRWVHLAVPVGRENEIRQIARQMIEAERNYPELPKRQEIIDRLSRQTEELQQSMLADMTREQIRIMKAEAKRYRCPKCWMTMAAFITGGGVGLCDKCGVPVKELEADDPASKLGYHDFIRQCAQQDFPPAQSDVPHVAGE